MDTNVSNNTYKAVIYDDKGDVIPLPAGKTDICTHKEVLAGFDKLKLSDGVIQSHIDALYLTGCTEINHGTQSMLLMVHTGFMMVDMRPSGVQE